jgi:hypothetical protein
VSLITILNRKTQHSQIANAISHYDAAKENLTMIAARCAQINLGA